MLQTMTSFANLLAASLTAGAMFGVWLGLSPGGLPASDYVVQQQYLIKGMNTAMPLLGAATVILTLAHAACVRASRPQLTTLLLCAGCFMLAGLITRFQNQPINAMVVTWSHDSIPADWMAIRDAWWRWHVARTVAGILGLSLLIGSSTT